MEPPLLRDRVSDWHGLRPADVCERQAWSAFTSVAVDLKRPEPTAEALAEGTAVWAAIAFHSDGPGFRLRRSLLHGQPSLRLVQRFGAPP